MEKLLTAIRRAGILAEPVLADDVDTVSGSGGAYALLARLLRSPAFEVAVRDFGNSDCRVCETHLARFGG